MIESEPTTADAALALQLLQGSPDGLLLMDAEGRIVLANRSAAMMFGYADAPGAEGLVGRVVEELVPDEQRGPHVALRRSYTDDPHPRPMGTELRLLGQHRSGSLFPVEVSLSPITVDGNIQTVATVRDVTERQDARAKLELQEERARIAHDLHDLVIQRLFAAGMSLQSVTNLIESPVARDRVIAVTDELDETVSAIRSAIFRIGTPDETRNLASHVASLVEERSRHLGFTPDLLIAGSLDDIPDFIGDQLVETLTEAVTNVARHAHATVATIRITRTDDTISLTVRDNGRGIDATPRPLGGLSSLVWRAAALGGSCSVAPLQPAGTELVWQVPI
jgi:PAS domain S-box-containing protein